jgi:hypothetical protein
MDVNRSHGSLCQGVTDFRAFFWIYVRPHSKCRRGGRDFLMLVGQVFLEKFRL